MVSSVQLITRSGNWQPLGSLWAEDAFSQPMSQCGLSQNSPMQCGEGLSGHSLWMQHPYLKQGHAKVSTSSRCFHVMYFTEMFPEKLLKWHRQGNHQIYSFFIDAADKQHNHITKLHKQPGAQTSNELCMVWKLAPEEVSASLPSLPS